ncbi:hypothetical protein Cni_G28226 [Canna indica]|uniref:Uncharacterized protein n=1 Tax=Canna indica TaxID=4628 RepID=A0AAQ3L2A5_9LILI|nr:hypothetical protein Cni_G28226 [Canna indica]
MLRSFLRARRPIRPATADGPGDLLRARIREREQARRQRRDPSKDEFVVTVPESSKWLDTLTWPMALSAAALTLFVKLLMMHHDATSEERMKRKAEKAPSGQGSVRMLTPEEWDAIQEIPPFTPFDSTSARPNSRIRTGEPVPLEDVKDWAIDVFRDAFTRVEESVKHK